MATKDYYFVLGIPRTESQQGIRKAFRDLAREHHPDRAGPDGTPVFREVVEAYRVLSDPRRREAHDARLRRESRARERRGGREAGRPTDAAASFDTRGPARTTGWGPLPEMRPFERPSAIRPSAASLLDRVLRNFTRGGLAKGEHPEPLLCDIALTREEARRGGVLPIRLPIESPCPRCHGAGHFAGIRCAACDAVGRVRSEVVVPVEVPAGVAPGTVVEQPLDAWAIRNLWLRARFRVVD